MFTFIESIEDLAFLNEELLLKPYVGLALLQINDAEEIYLVDTVLIDDPKDHSSFLFSDSVTKIFHSCKEDIEAVYSWTGKKMVNLFDTQLAEAFLNGHYSIGYQGLVEEKIGITVDKGETRSNWIRRPLTDSQLNYLIELFMEQKQALTVSNKLEWHNEELDFLSSRIFSPIAYDEDINIGLTKAEEKNLLNKFNDIVLHIAELKEINPTMFFSKKSQKDFLRLAINEGFEKASSEITTWRSKLIAEPLGSLFQDY